MSIKLEYGLKNGRLVHISDTVNGLGCECICPKCNAVLIAKKGDIKENHFAHYNSEDCIGAAETALHLLAKEIIQDNKQVAIPCWGHQYYKFYKRSICIFDNVMLEQRIENIIPDIVGYKNNIPMIIEIKVTHGVEPQKLNKIKIMNISAIEIDLSELPRNIKREDLKKILLEISPYSEKVKWLYNKFDKQMLKALRLIHSQTLAAMMVLEEDIKIMEVDQKVFQKQTQDVIIQKSIFEIDNNQSPEEILIATFGVDLVEILDE